MALLFELFIIYAEKSKKFAFHNFERFKKFHIIFILLFVLFSYTIVISSFMESSLFLFTYIFEIIILHMNFLWKKKKKAEENLADYVFVMYATSEHQRT